ncbi:HEAT repeat-containing protein 6-like isoform X2 [Sycon ciliatum]|uniref:HEAT repeat-containing protein 6-like isoform X2 n=1 Tax=Sycon ciliatum TaxID=27933 RepID=UPI0031F67A77
MAHQQQQFSECLRAVKCMRPGADCRYELNEQLDALLKCKYHSYAQPPSAEEIEDVLVTCIRLVTPAYVVLLSKTAQLIHYALSKHMMVLSRAGFGDVMAFTLSAVETEWTVADGLKALSAVLVRHNHLLSAKYVAILAGQGTAALGGLLYKAIANQENIDACSSALLCLGLLANKSASCVKPVLDEAAVSRAISTVLQCLQASAGNMPANPEVMKLCTACAQALALLWPLSKTAGDLHGTTVVNHCKTLLDMTCGAKDPDRTQPAVTVAHPSHSSESVGYSGVRGHGTEGIQGATVTEPVLPSSVVNSLKATGMTIELGTGDSSRSTGCAGRAPRRRKKKKKKKKKDGADNSQAVMAVPDGDTAPANGLVSAESGGESEDPGDSGPGNLAVEVAQSVLVSPPSVPVPSRPVKSVLPSPSLAKLQPSSDWRAPGSAPSVTSRSSQDSALSVFPSVTSSDSEQSDLEVTRRKPLPQRKEEELELRTLLLLDQVFSSLHRKTTFSFWPMLFPDVTISSRGPLFSVALGSSCSKSRATAFMVIGRLLDASRQYLLLADDSVARSHHRAFTPLSQTLGSILRQLYEYTVQLLTMTSSQREVSNSVLVQAVKCLSLFVWNAPFHRLRTGYLTRVVSALEPLLTRRDITVRTACLTCLGAVVCVHAPLDEVSDALRPTVLLRSGAAGPAAPLLRLGSGSHRDSPSEVASSSATDGDGLSDWRVVHHAGQQTPHMRKPSIESTAGIAGGADSFSWLSLKDGLDELWFSEFTFPSSTSWLCRLTVHLIVSKAVANSPALTHNSSVKSATPPPFRQKLVIRTEAMQVLLGLAHNYFHLVRAYWRSLVYVALEVLIVDTEETMRLHTYKLLTTLLRHIGDGIDAGDEHGGATDGCDQVSMNELAELWQLLLDTCLLPCVSCSTAGGANSSAAILSATVKSAALDCVAAINPDAFSQIDACTRDVCLDSVKKLCNDADQVAQCSAIRALGVFFTHPKLRKTTSFLVSCVNIVRTSLELPVLAVRAKSSWAFGNLAEAVMLNREEDIAMDYDLVMELLAQAVKTSADHDRVKTGGVRAIGCLLQCLSDEDCGKEEVLVLVQSGMQQLTKVVASSAITAKVRWNACYAIRTALRNPALPTGCSAWSQGMFTALLSVAQKHKNFKVRIGAAAALLAPEHRVAFGDSQRFQWICDLLLSALESCENLSDFGDLRYKDTLQRQLCIVVLRLISLAENRDGERLLALLMPKLALLHSVFQSVLGKDKTESRHQTAAKEHDADDGADADVTDKSSPYSVKELLDVLRDRLTSLQTAGDGNAHLKQVYTHILEPTGSREEFPFEPNYT